MDSKVTSKSRLQKNDRESTTLPPFQIRRPKTKDSVLGRRIAAVKSIITRQEHERRSREQVSVSIYSRPLHDTKNNDCFINRYRRRTMKSSWRFCVTLGRKQTPERKMNDMTGLLPESIISGRGNFIKTKGPNSSKRTLWCNSHWQANSFPGMKRIWLRGEKDYRRHSTRLTLRGTGN